MNSSLPIQTSIGLIGKIILVDKWQVKEIIGLWQLWLVVASGIVLMAIISTDFMLCNGSQPEIQCIGLVSPIDLIQRITPSNADVLSELLNILTLTSLPRSKINCEQNILLNFLSYCFISLASKPPNISILSWLRSMFLTIVPVVFYEVNKVEESYYSCEAQAK